MYMYETREDINKLLVQDHLLHCVALVAPVWCSASPFWISSCSLCYTTELHTSLIDMFLHVYTYLGPARLPIRCDNTLALMLILAVNCQTELDLDQW